MRSRDTDRRRQRRGNRRIRDLFWSWGEIMRHKIRWPMLACMAIMVATTLFAPWPGTGAGTWVWKHRPGQRHFRDMVNRKVGWYPTRRASSPAAQRAAMPPPLAVEVLDVGLSLPLQERAPSPQLVAHGPGTAGERFVGSIVDQIHDPRILALQHGVLLPEPPPLRSVSAPDLMVLEPLQVHEAFLAERAATPPPAYLSAGPPEFHAPLRPVEVYNPPAIERVPSMGGEFDFRGEGAFMWSPEDATWHSRSPSPVMSAGEHPAGMFAPVAVDLPPAPPPHVPEGPLPDFSTYLRQGLGEPGASRLPAGLTFDELLRRYGAVN